MNKYLVSTLLLFIVVSAEAQRPADKNPRPYKDGNNSDTGRHYASLITEDATSFKGLWTIHQVGEKYYFELPYSLLGKDLLFVTRITAAPPTSKLYSGDEVSNFVVAFEQGPGKRIFLKKRSFSTYTADSLAPVYTAVTRSGLMPIMASFKIEATTPDATGIVVDATDFMLADNEGFSLVPEIKAHNSLTDLVADKTYISSLMCFAANIEIATVKTYTKQVSQVFEGTRGNTVSTSTMSYGLNTSIVLLPSNPMKLRFEDSRVGYFALQQKDYDANPGGVSMRSYVKRWRLEPKPDEVEAYLRGVLVEPRHPIVFYIDPATPAKWIPYLEQGVKDWQQAFEQAGFKNAIMAKKAPTKQEDPTWSLYDARHSAIVYKPSEIENASGPSIADPRTGEILESHINWYHNIIQLLHDWYMVQCGSVDPRAQKMAFSDSLMGALIRFVIAHEVGHTLGLQHNFAASSTVPVRNLRNRQWVKENGIAPSLMDYARFNFVAQPEDSITGQGLINKIGVYDRWAIQWGYQWFPDASPEEERSRLGRLTTERLKDRRLRFGLPFIDPRIQAEDLGDNAMLANEYGIKNLKRIIPRLREWTQLPNEDYTSLDRMYKQLQAQFRNYLNHTRTYICGTYRSAENAELKGPVYQPIPTLLQKQAVAFLKNNLLITPTWIIDTAILARTGQTALGLINELQDDVLKKLLHPRIGMLLMVSRNESTFGSSRTYTLLQLLSDLKQAIWTELDSHQPIDMYRRNLQRIYVYYLLESLTSMDSKSWGALVVMPVTGLTNIAAHDVEAILAGHLKELKKEVDKARPFYRDPLIRFHLDYISEQIHAALGLKGG